MHRLPILVVASLLCEASFLCQLSWPQGLLDATYTADTALTVFADTATNSLPAGTQFNALQTQLSVGSPSGHGGAGVTVGFEHSRKLGTRVQLLEIANMTDSGTAGYGPHETLLVLVGTGAVRAKITVRFAATSAAPNLTNATSMIDIGDDGTFELSGALNAPVRFEQSVVVPASGLPIRTITQGDAMHAALAGRVIVNAVTIIQVRPESRCSVTAGGPGCVFAASPTINGAMTFDEALVLDSRAFPGQPTLLMVGIQSIQIPLSGGLCTLSVVPLLTIPGVTDAAGRLTQEFPVPPGFQGMILLQQLTTGVRASPAPILSTPALVLACT